MTSWVITIDASMPDHWTRAKEAGFWDFRNPQHIRSGDELFFWLNKASFIGWATATSDAFTHSEANGPWRDYASGKYKQRVYLAPRADDPRKSMKWSELQPHLETERKLNAGVLEIPSEAGQAFLRSLFVSNIQVDIAFAAQGSLDVRVLYDDQRQFRQQLNTYREGQASFRADLLKAYAGKCAMSGCCDTPSLEAAHIARYLGPQSNHVQNGLLLRSDLHKLFDKWLISVTPDLVIHVSPELKFSTYRDLDGYSLRRSLSLADRPDPKVLANHNAKAPWLRKQR